MYSTKLLEYRVFLFFGIEKKFTLIIESGLRCAYFSLILFHIFKKSYF